MSEQAPAPEFIQHNFSLQTMESGLEVARSRAKHSYSEYQDEVNSTAESPVKTRGIVYKKTDLKGNNGKPFIIAEQLGSHGSKASDSHIEENNDKVETLLSETESPDGDEAPDEASTEVLPPQGPTEPAKDQLISLSPNSGKFRHSQSYLSWYRHNRKPQIEELRKEHGYKLGKRIVARLASFTDYGVGTDSWSPNLYEKYVSSDEVSNTSAEANMSKPAEPITSTQPQRSQRPPAPTNRGRNQAMDLVTPDETGEPAELDDDITDHDRTSQVDDQKARSITPEINKTKLKNITSTSENLSEATKKQQNALKEHKLVKDTYDQAVAKYVALKNNPNAHNEDIDAADAEANRALEEMARIDMRDAKIIADIQRSESEA
jgi:hypothetical protein